MCGIAGIYGINLGATEHAVFERLLNVNVYRGKHSTGIIRIHKDGNRFRNRVIRSLKPSPALIYSPEGQEFLAFDKNKPSHAFIGHTRHATMGEVNLKNTHPFSFDKVVGVHNGTIDYSFEGSTLYDTDSEALYKLINDKGITAALKEVAYRSPAYALVWVDKKKNTLNFVRNTKRPLFFTYLFNRTSIVWSSTREDLEYIIDKTNLTTYGWPSHKADEKYFTLNPNEHMEIKLGDSPKEAKITKLDVPVAVVSTTYRHGNYGNIGRGYYEDWWEENEKTSTDTTKAVTTTSSTSKSKDTASLIHLPWLNDTPSKTRLPKNPGEPESEQELAFRLSEGCFSCGTGVDINNHTERERVAWWDREYYACGDCFENVDGRHDWVWRTICNDWSSDSRPESVDKTA